jgi:hypothetical protein
MIAVPRREVSKIRLIGAGALAVLWLALAGCTAAAPVPSALPTANASANAQQIKVGDCVNDGLAAGTISTVPTVPCAQPHDGEVYGAFRVKDGAFPGDEAIKSLAILRCQKAFGQFTGVAYDSTTTLTFSWYHPTEASWEKDGDRVIQCLVSRLDAAGKPEKSTGTLRDAGA